MLRSAYSGLSVVNGDPSPCGIRRSEGYSFAWKRMPTSPVEPSCAEEGKAKVCPWKRSCLLSSMPKPRSAMWRKSPTRKASTLSSGRPRRSPPLPQSTVAAGNSKAAGRASSSLRTATGDTAAASARACGTATGTPAPMGRTPTGERQAHNSRKISAARPAPSVDASPMFAGSATVVPTPIVQRAPNAKTFSRRCTKSFSSVLGG
mmetsp:Transcript_85492/g.217976  ORF Transcript_85492/g.217976 Transcript_85492/m.217976 type:complete len:205 (+) Transcript_85492:434-1048(+)